MHCKQTLDNILDFFNYKENKFKSNLNYISQIQPEDPSIHTEKEINVNSIYMDLNIETDNSF